MTDTWEQAVLRVISNKGREPIHLRDIYKEMENHPLVTHYHNELWGSQAKYKHWIRSALARLKNEGKIVRVERAIYSLPESN